MLRAEVGGVLLVLQVSTLLVLRAVNRGGGRFSGGEGTESAWRRTSGLCSVSWTDDFGGQIPNTSPSAPSSDRETAISIGTLFMTCT